MKNCEDIRKWFVDAIYNELDEEQTQFLEDHLQQCPDCSQEYNHIRNTINLMDNYSRPEPEQEFWNGYWDKLSTRLETERKKVAIKDWLVENECNSPSLIMDRIDTDAVITDKDGKIISGLDVQATKLREEFPATFDKKQAKGDTPRDQSKDRNLNIDPDGIKRGWSDAKKRGNLGEQIKYERLATEQKIKLE